MEVDGIFFIKEFNKFMFKKEEVSIIFDNNNQENFDVEIVEVKLSSNKINDIILKLTADNEFFQKEKQKK